MIKDIYHGACIAIAILLAAVIISNIVLSLP